MAIPMSSGGSTTQASGGTGSKRPGHGGTTSAPRGGSGGTAGTTSDAGASDELDAGPDDGGARHVPGKYYACLCRLPGGGERGHGTEALPLVALVAGLVGRRRSRVARSARPRA
jgi:hypothetical protein